MKIVLPLLAAMMAPPLVIQAAENAASDVIRDGAVQQQTIKERSSVVAGQLSALLAEYERNGLLGDDAAQVEAMRKALEGLNEKEMQEAIRLLQEAHSASDSSTATQHVSGAIRSQQAILDALRNMLTAHQKKSTAAELAETFSELADRQQQNIATAEELKNWMEENANNVELPTATKASLESQKLEQASIAKEVEMAAARTEQIARNAKDPAEARAAMAAANAMRDLAKRAEEVNKALDIADLNKGMAQEKEIRKELKKLASQLAPPANPEERAEQLARELDAAMRMQEDLKNLAESAANRQDFEKWLDHTLKNERFRRDLEKRGVNPEDRQAVSQDEGVQKQFKMEQSRAGNELSGLRTNQNEVRRKAEDFAEDFSSVSPSLARNLQQARDAAAAAAENLKSKNGAQAVAEQQKAADALARAAEEVKQRLAAMQAEKDLPADRAAALEQLQKQAANLRQHQEALAKQAAAATNPADRQALKTQQENLQRHAERLAAQAATLERQGGKEDTKAANSLRNAGQQMDQAADAMTQPGKENAASRAQSNAMQSLAQAEQQLGEQAAEARRAMAALQEMAKEVEELQGIIKDQTGLEADTIKRSAEDKAKVAGELKKYAGRQSWIGKRTNRLSEDITKQAIALDVPPYLAAAKADMDRSEEALNAANASDSASAQRDAINDLLKALRALQAKQQEQQQLAGAQNANQQQQAQNQQQQNQQQQNAAQQAAQAMEQLAQQVANAQQQLQQSGQQQNQQAANQLADAAREASRMAANQALPEQAAEAMQQAGEQLAQAAQQAAGAQNQQAQAEAQKGAESLAKASAAMQAAMAGISPTEAPLPDEATLAQMGQQPPQSGQRNQQNQQQQGGQSEQAQEDGTGPGGGEVEFQGATLADLKLVLQGLPEREREAILQGQQEPYPKEYERLVQQYMMNLASGESAN